MNEHCDHVILISNISGLYEYGFVENFTKT